MEKKKFIHVLCDFLQGELERKDLQIVHLKAKLYDAMVLMEEE